MDIGAIANWAVANKTNIASIVASVVAISSVVLNMLPTPTTTSNKFYSFVYNIIHTVALNKKGQ